MKSYCCLISTSELAARKSPVQSWCFCTPLAPHAPSIEFGTSANFAVSLLMHCLPPLFAFACALRSSSARSRNALFVLIIFSRFTSCTQHRVWHLGKFCRLFADALLASLVCLCMRAPELISPVPECAVRLDHFPH